MVVVIYAREMTLVSSAWARWTLPTNRGKLQGMSSNAKRLGEYVLRRRTEPDLTQIEAWHAGGPSNTTQTTIENGNLETLTRATARKIDAGLGWEEGSARKVWNGGEPQVSTGPRSLAQEVRQSNLSPAAKERILERLIELEPPP